MSSHVIHGDCVRLMGVWMPPNSIDAIVTDPPYGLEFMGREWDRLGDVGKTSHAGPRERGDGDFAGFRVAYNGSSNVRCRNCGKWKWGHTEGDGGGGGKRCECADPDFPSNRPRQAQAMQRWHERWAIEAYRVLKPGGHVLAFGGTRTYHRLACALEDAGFEIRDCLSWLYGSGFPKSHDISKAIDREAGAVREVTGQRDTFTGMDKTKNWKCSSPRIMDVTAPATETAQQWDGWGTALKPAWEPIILARKPIMRNTVAQNVQAFGTGALNIDACRIGHSSADDLAVSLGKNPGRVDTVTSDVYGAGRPQQSVNTLGRWPANVVLDEDAAALLDAQSGERPSGAWDGNRNTPKTSGIFGEFESRQERGKDGDTGGASRFFKVVQEDEPCTSANDAALSSSQPSERGGSVPSDAATAAGNGQSYPEPSTNETPSESRQSGENATQPTRYIGQKFSQGSLLQSESNPDRVSAAGPNEPTDTTTTTGNRSPSGSSAESATSQSMSSSEAVGDQDFAGNRFWYTAKASRAERNKGLDGLPERDSMKWSGGSEQMRGVAGTYPDGSPRPEQHAKNHHPTVKPLDLMQWLVRLVTPKGGTVLDPFCGSGSTLVAADREGFDAIGIDLDPEYAEIARRRFVGDAPLFAEVIE
jgi:DNA modification methylase